MELALGIILGMISLICILGGMNLMIKGAGAFLTEPAPRVLDNLFRFLSGIYFGLGFLMAWVTFHVREMNDLIYCIAIVVIFSGLGRWYSRLKVGMAGPYFDYIMVFEVMLGLALIVLQYSRG
jgi:hypothetical protein